ncbi:uncharacterized protein LOC111752597 [Loxodonta africana]|uniref:uncharacterized protein LOC111752597 n=1 Tax=Loxodonta africana TaxID=9785 RepID=UPI0030D110FF
MVRKGRPTLWDEQQDRHGRPTPRSPPVAWKFPSPLPIIDQEQIVVKATEMPHTGLRRSGENYANTPGFAGDSRERNRRSYNVPHGGTPRPLQEVTEKSLSARRSPARAPRHLLGDTPRSLRAWRSPSSLPRPPPLGHPDPPVDTPRPLLAVTPDLVEDTLDLCGHPEASPRGHPETPRGHPEPLRTPRDPSLRTPRNSLQTPREPRGHSDPAWGHPEAPPRGLSRSPLTLRGPSLWTSQISVDTPRPHLAGIPDLPRHPEAPMDTRSRYLAPREAPGRAFPCPQPAETQPQSLAQRSPPGSRGSPPRRPPAAYRASRPPAAGLRSAGVSRPAALHAHHPGLRRRTHVSQRCLKAPRPAVR